MKNFEFIIISLLVLAVPAYFVISLIIGFFEEAKTKRQFFRKLVKFILLILLIFIFCYFIFLIQPLFENIEIGLKASWKNIRNTWIIVGIKYLLFYIFLILYWLFSLSLTFFSSFMIIGIPYLILEFIIKKISKDEDIRSFPFFPDKDIKEWILFLFFVCSFLIISFWIFSHFFWDMLPLPRAL
jgi:hypothetical protein